MDTPTPEELLRSNAGRLESWKKIAGYLKRDVTTVQRWEKREGMPVHRQLHDKLGSVYAFRAELDAWVQGRSEQADGATAPPDATPARGTSGIARRRWLLAAALAAAIALFAIGAARRSDYFWRDPIAGAVFQPVTGFDGKNEAAALSRDGRFVAFLSDRGGRMDVWVTQLGSGEFHNLTGGIAGELVNPSIRTLGFSPDGSLVLFWLRRPSPAAGEDISIWAVPMLGGEPRPYLAGAAEAAWSPDGHRLAYHTAKPGDPLFISDHNGLSHTQPISMAPPGLHSHFPVWGAHDFIYVVQGTLPEPLDIWRLGIGGEPAQRITSHQARVTYPVLLDERTLLYLASTPDGADAAVYGMDVERRIPHRLSFGVEHYTSLAASADGRRVVATVSEPQPTLWRVVLPNAAASEAPPLRITLATGSGFAPRLGPNYLLYVAAAGTGDSIWKISGAALTQLWTGSDARIIGGPTISADGRLMAFSVKQQAKALLYIMGTDGSGIRMVSDSLQLRGAPAFEPDGLSVTSAADVGGAPRLFRIPLQGKAANSLVSDYAVDPTWSSDGKFFVYSGPDIGTKFTVNAASAAGSAHALPALTLTRGARHLALLPGNTKLVFLQGELQHKNLWMIDLESGATQQLTHLPGDFDARDFDISMDGREAILERAQSRSHVIAIERTR